MLRYYCSWKSLFTGATVTKYILKISSCVLTKYEAQPTELMSCVTWLDSAESHNWGDKPKQGTFSCFGTAMMLNCLQNKKSSLCLCFCLSCSFSPPPLFLPLSLPQSISPFFTPSHSEGLVQFHTCSQTVSP